MGKEEHQHNIPIEKWQHMKRKSTGILAR